MTMRANASVAEKAILRFRGLLTFAWYKTLYGGAFACKGVPKIRKGFSLIIEPGAKVTVGRSVFFNNYCSINCRQRVSIGDGCLFGEGVRIYDHNHRFNVPDKPIADQGFKTAPVIIGRNCWIGSDVVILKGAAIGDNCVIGAGCVVSGAIPANSVYKTSTPCTTTPIRYKKSEVTA